jgi:hypothetical protein
MVEEKKKLMFGKIFQKIQMMPHVTFLVTMCEQTIGTCIVIASVVARVHP